MVTPIRILLTGFEPFGKNTVNPSEMVVREIAAVQFEGTVVDTLVFPVSFERASAMLKQWLAAHPRYDYIISMGVAGNRECLSLERVAINCMDAAGPDNDGFVPQDQPVDSTAPVAYFTTLPIKQMKEWLMNETDIPVKVSNTAGTYVCNTLFFSAINDITQQEISTKCGFIHLPSLQNMPLETMAHGIVVIINNLIKHNNYGSQN